MSFLRKVWANNPAGGTPITAAELNRIEDGIAQRELDLFLTLAAEVSPLIVGAVTRDPATLVVTAATLRWPDGVSGVFTATVFDAATGAVNAYTVTRATVPAVTFTQPAMTRDANGAITNRPALVVT